MRSKVVALFTLYAFVAVALVPAGAARADEAADFAAARQHFEAGRNAYLAGDYAGAINEFSLAQSLRPSPILDYNIGMSYEAIGDGQNAYAAFSRYLAAKPDAQNRAEVEQRMTALVERAQQQAAQAPPPATAGPPPSPSPTASPSSGGQAEPAPQPGTDPYGRAYAPGPPSPPMPPPPRKKGSRWWIVFPIVGAVAITAGIIWFVAANHNSGCNTPGCYPYERGLGTQPDAPPLLRF